MSNEPLHDQHVLDWEAAWDAEIDSLDGTLPLPPLMKAALELGLQLAMLNALDDDPDAQVH